jgi:beta-phosphoglucomutase-like phosphatase (HAD superfamily)
VELALFDLEGVLVDTLAARGEAVTRALTAAGVDAPPALARWIAAEGAGAAIAAAFASARLLHPDVAPDLDETAAELAELRAERYLAERLAAGVALVPGAREAVEALGRRLRLGVVTRLRRRDAAFLLELAGLEPAFAVVVTGDDVRQPAPAPDGHRRALDRLARRRAPVAAVEPAAAAVSFESSVPGARAARGAAVRVVGVGEGLRPGDAVGAPGAAVDAWVPMIAGLTYDSLFALLHPAPHGDR